MDATPQNGHYKIYYKHGLYYVESQYVNVQYTNTQKPAISYKAEVSADCDVSDGSSVVGKVKQVQQLMLLKKIMTAQIQKSISIQKNVIFLQAI